VIIPNRSRIKSFFMCGSCWFMNSLKVNVWNVD
jgi:predicted ferric reductase